MHNNPLNKINHDGSSLTPFDIAKIKLYLWDYETASSYPFILDVKIFPELFNRFEVFASLKQLTAHRIIQANGNSEGKKRKYTNGTDH